jgi:NADPH:quinone reductase
VPEGVSPEEAATTNVALTALHALRRAQFQPGEVLAIIGLGMVGQCLAQLAAANGGRALATDRYPLRLEIARACGIEAAVDAGSGDFLADVRRRTNGLGADTVAICVGGGSSDLMHLAVRLVRPSGVVLMVGGPILPDFSGASGDASPHLKEIDLRWVYGRGAGSRDPAWNRGDVEYPRRFVRWDALNNLEALLHLQATGRLRTQPLLTHRFPVDRAGEAADLLIEHPDQALGVVLTYSS